MIQNQIIRTLATQLKNCRSIGAAVLYGSFARKDASANSDIDIALLVEKSFDETEIIKQLENLLKEYDMLHILHIKLRKKIAVYFKSIPKIEIALLGEIEEISRNYHGSNIPADLISTTILFDKTQSIEPFLAKLANTGNDSNKKSIVKNLIDKFIYEFESSSYFHSRSDAYKFYYFYNIAFHVAVQLKYLAKGKTKFYFLPKNFVVENLSNEEDRKNFYALAGSTYLRDANTQKRLLLDFFYKAVDELEYSAKARIKDILEQIYHRDFLWNFRDIAKFNPLAKPQKIYRTSAITSYQDESFILDFLKGNGINTIVDLRAENEIEINPYNKVFIRHFNYVKAPFDPWNQPKWFKDSYHYGTNTEIAYRFFVKACKTEVLKVFEAIHTTKDAVAIHCLAGKDRTGFIILLINMLIKTPYRTMLIDYMASELDAEEDKFKIYYDNIINEGGIIQYLLSCGLSKQKLSEIKQNLSK